MTSCPDMFPSIHQPIIYYKAVSPLRSPIYLTPRQKKADSTNHATLDQSLTSRETMFQ